MRNCFTTQLNITLAVGCSSEVDLRTPSAINFVIQQNYPLTGLSTSQFCTAMLLVLTVAYRLREGLLRKHGAEQGRSPSHPENDGGKGFAFAARTKLVRRMTVTLLLITLAIFVAVGTALYLVYRETEPDLPPRHSAHRHTAAH